MKYKIGFSVLLIGLLLHFEVSANDGFGIDYDARHNLINCVVIENADEFNKDGKYLFFDYSIAVGDRLGRPWTQVEKEKCYEYSTDTTDVSSFVLIETEDTEPINILNTSAKEEFKSLYFWGTEEKSIDFYKKYKDSIKFFDEIESYYYYDNHFRGTGLDSHNMYINKLNEINFKNFKYIFGHGIVSFISNQNGEDLLEKYLKENGEGDLSDKLFSYREKIINSLKSYESEISSEYNSCLTNVKRVEYHEKVIWDIDRPAFESKGMFVLLKNNNLLKVNSLRDVLDEDCKEKIYDIHKKWIDTLNKQGDGYYGIIQQIKSFQSSDPDFSSSIYSSVDYPHWDFDYMISLNEEVVELKKEYTETAPSVSNNEPSELDSEDINVSQKIINTFDSVMTEKNYLFCLYLVLPLLIILGYLIYRRKNKI